MVPRTKWPIRLVGTSLELTTNHIAAAAASKSLQSCPTLCDPRDSGYQAPPIPGILQARTLEWVAIAFSKKNIYFCFIDYAKAFDCVGHTNCGKYLKRWEYQTTLPAS